MSSQPQKATCSLDETDLTLEDRRALDEVFNRLYGKIRQLASRVKWSGSNPTLNPTALVHEAYLKLLKDPPELRSRSYEEVIAIFANTMRQILVDGARRKNAQKRVCGDLPERTDLPVEDAVVLDSALGELERSHPVQARVVQCRFLLGMTVSETASALKLSKRTVEREWEQAKTALSRKLQPSSGRAE